MELLRAEIDSTTSTLREGMDDVDEEVEKRVDGVAERKGLRSAVKRISRKTISKVSTACISTHMFVQRGLCQYPACFIGTHSLTIPSMISSHA